MNLLKVLKEVTIPIKPLGFNSEESNEIVAEIEKDTAWLDKLDVYWCQDTNSRLRDGKHELSHSAAMTSLADDIIKRISTAAQILRHKFYRITFSNDSSAVRDGSRRRFQIFLRIRRLSFSFPPEKKFCNHGVIGQPLHVRDRFRNFSVGGFRKEEERDDGGDRQGADDEVGQSLVDDRQQVDDERGEGGADFRGRVEESVRRVPDRRRKHFFGQKSDA